MADIENLKFNGVIGQPKIGPNAPVELEFHTAFRNSESQTVVVDYYDETPQEKDNNDMGVYLQSGFQRELLLNEEDSRFVRALATALHNKRATIQITDDGFISQPMPLDMEVVDVNKDGEFTGQDILDAVSNAMTGKTNNGPAR